MHFWGWYQSVDNFQMVQLVGGGASLLNFLCTTPSSDTLFYWPCKRMMNVKNRTLYLNQERTDWLNGLEKTETDF